MALVTELASAVSMTWANARHRLGCGTPQQCLIRVRLDPWIYYRSVGWTSFVSSGRPRPPPIKPSSRLLPAGSSAAQPATGSRSRSSLCFPSRSADCSNSVWRHTGHGCCDFLIAQDRLGLRNQLACGLHPEPTEFPRVPLPNLPAIGSQIGDDETVRVFPDFMPTYVDCLHRVFLKWGRGLPNDPQMVDIRERPCRRTGAADSLGIVGRVAFRK